MLWLRCVLFVYISNQCGLLTHLEVSQLFLERISATRFNSHLELAKSTIASNLDYFQAGSVFPDWGYGCLGSDDASEIAHWPPFYNALLDSVVEQKDDKLIAFVLGVISHSISDVMWHGIGEYKNGFLQALKEINFKHSTDNYHAIADQGGDLVLAYRNNLSYIKPNIKYPDSEIIKAYKKVNKNVNRYQLSICTNIKDKYLKATINAGKYLYGKFGVNKAPFLVSYIEKYIQGGLHSMVDDIVECWIKVMNKINQKSNEYISCSPSLTNATAKSYGTALELDLEDLNFKSFNEPKKEFNHIYPFKNCKNLEELSKDKIIDIEGQLSSENLGSSFDVSSQNNIINVVVTSLALQDQEEENVPNNKIIIYSYSNNLLTLIDNIHPKKDSFFGKEIKFINSNDKLGLIVIVNKYCKKNKNKLQSTELNIHFRESGKFLNEPSLRLKIPTSKDRHSGNFRSSEHFLEVGDVNNDGINDIILGMPFSDYENNVQSGMVCVYLDFRNDKPSWCITSPKKQPYEWFGSKAKTILIKNKTYLLISAPNHHSLNKTSVGALYFIPIVNNDKPLYDKIKEYDIDDGDFILGEGLFLIKGNEENGHIGKAFDYEKKAQKLMFSSTALSNGNKWQAGIVYELHLNTLEIKKILYGKNSGGQLGYSLAYMNNGSGHIVSEPYSDYGNGMIHVADNDIYMCYKEIGDKKSRLGYQIKHIQTDRNNIVFIGSPYSSSDGKRFNGKIQILSLE